MAMGVWACETFHRETTPSEHLDELSKLVFTSQLHTGLNGFYQRQPSSRSANDILVGPRVATKNKSGDAGFAGPRPIHHAYKGWRSSCVTVDSTPFHSFARETPFDILFSYS